MDTNEPLTQKNLYLMFTTIQDVHQLTFLSRKNRNQGKKLAGPTCICLLCFGRTLMPMNLCESGWHLLQTPIPPWMEPLGIKHSEDPAITTVTTRPGQLKHHELYQCGKFCSYGAVKKNNNHQNSFYLRIYASAKGFNTAGLVLC